MQHSQYNPAQSFETEPWPSHMLPQPGQWPTNGAAQHMWRENDQAPMQPSPAYMAHPTHIEPHTGVIGGGWPEQAGATSIADAGWDAPSNPPGRQLRWRRAVAAIVVLVIVAGAIAYYTQPAEKPTPRATDSIALDQGSDDTGNLASNDNAEPLDVDATDATAQPPAPPVTGGAATPSSPASTAGSSSSHRGNASSHARQPRAQGGGAALAANKQRSARTTAGGGVDANGLPYTGASHWIAAILGMLLVAAGCLMHMRAVTIGATSAMYRRGPLLRPIDTIRVAIDRGGLDSIRSITDRLSRPSARSNSDFVSARRTR